MRAHVIYPAIMILLAMLISGCSHMSGRAETGDSAVIDYNRDSIISTGSVGRVSFYPAEGLPSLDVSEGFCDQSLLKLAMLAHPIVFYRAETGTWPDSWDVLTEKYMPLIPLYGDTGVTYELSDYARYGGSAPANTIIAEWDENGPALYIAQQTDEGLKCASLGKDYFSSFDGAFHDLSELANGEPSGMELPVYRAIHMMGSINQALLSSFYACNMRLPENTTEYLEGFVVNPEYSPGYTVTGESGIGGFQVLVDRNTDKSLFIGILGPPKAIFKLPFQYGFMSEMENPKDVSADLRVDNYCVLFDGAALFD